MIVEIMTKSESETRMLAKTLSKYLKPGDVITLEGELGTGKTTFVKGIAEGLNIKRTVTSPTFTMIKQYSGDLPLYHMDVYRLEGMEEDIGFDEHIYGNGVSIIEWAQFIEDFLPTERLMIQLEYIDDVSRKIKLNPVGLRYEKLLNVLNYS